MTASGENLFSYQCNELLSEEIFTTLFQSEKVLIERIVSPAGLKPDEKWYEQERDEWVVVIKGAGVLEYTGGRRQVLKEGDHVFLPAFLRHRVVETTQDMDTVWLAVHGDLKKQLQVEK